MSKRLLLVAAALCISLINPLSALAAAPTVTPKEGTLGTTITIRGSLFGQAEGAVLLGKTPCTMLTWRNNKITARIDAPLKAKTYDLKIVRNKKRAVTLEQAFTVARPRLDPPAVRPNFVTVGRRLKVTGSFLGRKGRKKIEIQNHAGRRRPCKILRDSMTAVTFRLPKRGAGLFHLRYTNAVGTALAMNWGTFALAPENPPSVAGTSHEGPETKDNAAALQYHGKLWFFFPDKEDDDLHLQYQTWDGKNWSGETDIVLDNGTKPVSNAQLTPILVDDIIYVLYTGTNSYLYLMSYNPLKPADKRWSQTKISDATMYDTGGRAAAVYNFVNNTIEIYWTPANTSLYMKTYNLADGTWGAKKQVRLQMDPSHPTIAPYVTAVFNRLDENGDYVTYLSWADTYAGAVTELKDGVPSYQTRLWYWQPENTKRAPSLIDLSEDELQVIYNHLGDEANYQTYNKRSRSVPVGQQYQSYVPFHSVQGTSWAPNGVVYSTKVADSTSPTGYRMDSNFYAIVGNNQIVDQTKWQLVSVSYLGYWKPVDKGTHVDFAGSDLGTVEERNQRIADTFPLWPVIGIMDMPPFVLNGHGECEDWTACGTDAKLSFQTGDTHGLGGELSVGAYFETGKKSPVTFDVSGGYSGGYDSSKTFTYTLTGGVEGNLEGRIAAFYLAPVFNVYTLEWYNLSGTPTGIYTQSVEVVGATIRKEAFDPLQGPDMSTLPTPYLDPAVFPRHAFEDDRERLNSYSIDPTDSLHNFESIVNPALSTSSWAVGSPGGFQWGIEQETSIDNGAYIDVKIGVELGHKIGFGVEGSFEIRVNTTTSKSIEAETVLLNQVAAEGYAEKINSFTVQGFWIKPDDSGYWIPRNRQGQGDSPWLITYRVTDYWPLTPAE